jgi:hypothetical protein
MLLFFLNLFLNKFGSEKTKSVPHSPGLPYMAKAIRNLSVFNKINLVFSIRNISSQEFHSALGKISVFNFMYNLLGLKNYYGLKI